jgi:Nucleotidyltransferase of unknown function (DUF6036)
MRTPDLAAGLGPCGCAPGIDLMSKKRQNGSARSTYAVRDNLPTERRLDPWELVWGQPYIDCDTLAAAIEEDLAKTPSPDYRSRLLIHDAAGAICSYWGSRRFRRWIGNSPVGDKIQTILTEEFPEEGFPHIRRKLVASIKSDLIERIFETLGRGIVERVEVHIAGSVPTLIKGLTFRPTQDIDFVNEVPAEIRRQGDTLKRIEESYGLSLGHVQSHYLPANWQTRRRFFGDFGGLRVYMVDEHDIFVSKLSSKQGKHRQDLEVMAQTMDKEKIKQRLLQDGKIFLDTPFLRIQIEENWRFIFREPLFAEQISQTPEAEPRATVAKRKRKKK